MNKIKTYNIMLSRVFPETHPKAGQPTGFSDKVLANFRYPTYDPTLLDHKKLHTIRANYKLWKKRFEEVERGDAVINLRVWIGKPYRSKTLLIKTLTSKDGIGLEKLEIVRTIDFGRPIWMLYLNGRQQDCNFLKSLAQNDGLSLEDWFAWFESYEKNKPMAIIHFTPFRYKPTIEL